MAETEEDSCGVLKSQVVYVSFSGCVYLGLPMFVDSGGKCHNTVEGESGDAFCPECKAPVEDLAPSPEEVLLRSRIKRRLFFLPDGRQLSAEKRASKSRRKAKDCHRVPAYGIVFVTPLGSAHLSLPLYVDGLGLCHIEMRDGESDEGKTGLADSLYNQGSLSSSAMADPAVRKKSMDAVLYQMMLLMRAKKNKDTQALPSKVLRRSAEAKKRVFSAKERKDNLIRELWDGLSGGTNSQALYRQAAPVKLSATCCNAPHGRRLRFHTLQQPRGAAVY